MSAVPRPPCLASRLTLFRPGQPEVNENSAERRVLRVGHVRDRNPRVPGADADRARRLRKRGRSDRILGTTALKRSGASRREAAPVKAG
jgi:hypothetical protein